MIERERTFLAKSIPNNLSDYNYKDILDIYFPDGLKHATIRIRKNGETFCITKKSPLDNNDSSILVEQTIELTKEEFLKLESEIKGRRIYKRRYKLPYKNYIAEFDIFYEQLKGLVLIDFEFGSIEEKNSFEVPDFCLAEVTQEEFIAGGILCGKKYVDLEKDLEKFNYSRINHQL